ncbi:MAG UNVERIFIED_CONTAM: DsbA family protein [Rickettsiaceae bacterium]|jgi:protein-disulfide isomerase
MESRDRIGKILLVTLILILAFVAYKRTNSTPQAVASVDERLEAQSIMSKDDVERIVKDYILNNPDIIIESVEKMQRRKMDEVNSQATELLKIKKPELENDKVSPSLGEGKTSVIMIYDYACSYCRKANDVVNKLLDDKNVKIIYKPFPILGDSSEYMTKIVLAVNKLFPDKFKAVHDALMSNKIASREDIVKILEDNKVNVTSVEAEFESPEIKASLAKFISLANELKIQGVPACNRRYSISRAFRTRSR